MSTVAFMRLTTSLPSAALAVLLTLTACSTDGGSAETTTAPTSEAPVDTIVETSAVDTSEPTTSAVDTSEPGTTTTTLDVAIVPPTAPNVAIEPGSVESAEQQLSTECEQAIAPIRALAKEYRSGLLLDEAGSATLNEALNEGSTACSPEDWEKYQQLELRGWLNAAP